jgi:hypothetical protein
MEFQPYRPVRSSSFVPTVVYWKRTGLGPPEMAVPKVDALTPHVVKMLDLRVECGFMTAYGSAWGIAVDGLEAAAIHFTRRPEFHHRLKSDLSRLQPSNGRLGDRAEALDPSVGRFSPCLSERRVEVMG